MEELIDSDLPVEQQDVFGVKQLTRHTELETLVGVDLVEMVPGQVSQIHRHNLAETVLYFVDGRAEVVVGEEIHPVKAGDRIRIHKGQFHGVRTPEGRCTFVSVQIPPILDQATNRLDLEPLAAGGE